jgi:hypothetical protein
VFRGDLVVFKGVPPLREAVEIGEDLIRRTLGAAEDVSAVAELQERFLTDADVKRLLRSTLEHAGVDPRRTYWDSPFLRFVPPLENGGEQVGAIGYHRDTWSSNLLQQTNWWMTIRPLSADRTLAFYPAYWGRPIENTSAGWDLAAMRQRRKAGEGEELPIVPEPSEPVDTSAELRVVIEPGDLLCFSGAHMHATVPNTSDRARCSVELRTVNLDDRKHGRGAPDLDGRAPVVPFEWFRSMVDGAPLTRDDPRL